MNFILTHKRTLIGISLGAAGGFAYYYFIGCASGSCPITSNPIISTLYGAMMGGLWFNSFNTKKTTQNEK